MLPKTGLVDLESLMTQRRPKPRRLGLCYCAFYKPCTIILSGQVYLRWTGTSVEAAHKSHISLVESSVPSHSWLKWEWSRSVVSHSLRPHGLYAAHQAPPSLGFSRQEHWSGLPFPSPMHGRKSESEVAQSRLTLRDPMDCSLPGSPPMGFSRREYWSGLPFLRNAGLTFKWIFW